MGSLTCYTTLFFAKNWNTPIAFSLSRIKLGRKGETKWAFIFKGPFSNPRRSTMCSQCIGCVVWWPGPFTIEPTTKAIMLKFSQILKETSYSFGDLLCRRCLYWIEFLRQNKPVNKNWQNQSRSRRLFLSLNLSFSQKILVLKATLFQTSNNYARSHFQVLKELMGKNTISPNVNKYTMHLYCVSLLVEGNSTIEL